MRIEIRARGLELTQAQRAHVREMVSSVLRRFGDRVGRVLVSLLDGGLPSAPNHLLCRIEVDVRPRKVRVEELDRDLSLGMSRAAERTSRAVVRALGRQHPLDLAFARR